MSSQPTRRDFLQGKAAADALLQRLEGKRDSESLQQEPPVECYRVQFARRAMACQFEVILNAGQYPQANDAALLALDLVDRLEDQLSVYRDHSEISRLNAAAGMRPVAVEPRLYALLTRAVQLFHETKGAYDITAAALSDVWGFTRRRGNLPAEADLQAALACVGSDELLLDHTNQSLKYQNPRLRINLGSIGKGYALERMAELLSECGLHDFLLHGGHSSVLARGTDSSQCEAQGWWVGLRHPLRPERRLGQVRLQNRALATSGSGTQFFMHEGKRYGHIIDPRSGWPAEGVLTASVIAPSGADADALSTAFYVMGVERARAYCAEHPEIAAILICPGRRAGSLEKHVIGLSPDEWQELEEERE